MEHSVDEIAIAAQLARIDTRLSGIEAGMDTNAKTMNTLVDRVGTQNHRLDKVEWTQEMARLAVVEKGKAEERTWANARWMVGIMFVAAGLLSGIVFGIVGLVEK